ncbi:MAG: hypothetical protein Q7K26_03285 [bacterium]|nr:hypothetical protein [bacterium]
MSFNHTNQKGFANIILVVVIVVLAGVVGYFAFVKKSEPIAQQPTPTPTQTNTPAPTPTPAPKISWKEEVLNQFKGLTSWTIDENVSDWRPLDLDPSQLAKYPKGKTVMLSKAFNENGFSNPGDSEKAVSEQSALESSIKTTLNKNGWKFIAGPTEGGFYHGYLYEKNGKPLLLGIGTRDAVTGGMFISLQFQY